MSSFADSKKKSVFLSFFLIDFFTAVSVGAMTIAAPRVAAYFSAGPSSISLLINAYLVSVSFFLLLMILYSESISGFWGEKSFLVQGMIFFSVGVLLCYFSIGIKMFLVGMVVQGFGAAALFLGELWIISKAYKKEITVPLAWAETGLASGIVAGPLVGGFFANLGVDGWRLIFLFVFFSAAAATLFFSANYRQKKEGARAKEIYGAKKKFGAGFWIVAASIAVVSAASLGMEFITSIYLQNVILFSPLVVGFILFSNSLGIVLGSQRAAKKKRGFLRGMEAGLVGLGFSVIAIGFSFHFDIVLAAILFLFAMGAANGYLGVVSYAYTSKILPESAIVKGAAIYLLMMQIGNAGGIQLESLWSFLRQNFAFFTVFLTLLVLAAFFFVSRARKKYPEAN